MGEEKKVVTNLDEVKEDELEKVAAGYVGSDKYTIEQYSEAGVTWEHNIWSKDRYFIHGKKITQDWAEKITGKYYALGRQLTRAELIVMGVPGF